jgi:hypothetical protein
MDSVKRSTSVDTLSEYVAQIQTSSAGAGDAAALDSDKLMLGVEHVLLSVSLNVTADPIDFDAEVIPIETPEYMREVKAYSRKGNGD